MSLVNDLQQARLEEEILSREGSRVDAMQGNPSLKISLRARLRRALEYLKEECERPGSELYKFVNDDRGLLCEVVVPPALRKRIEGGAFIEAIQLLPPTKGYRMMANISVKGKREVVRPLAQFARAILSSTIQVAAGGCIGLDQNRIYYPRAFAHARVGSNGGDLEESDIPGNDLALLLDLVTFAGTGDDPKNIKYALNVFEGNARGSGPFHVGADVPPNLKKVVTPALSFLGKMRRSLIDGGSNPLPDVAGFPLAASEGESLLTMPTTENPLNMKATSRRAGFSDQIGAPQAYWGIKRIHIARKIRNLQKVIKASRFRISERADENNEKSHVSTIDPVKLFAQLHRQLTDIAYREQRNESLRKSMGEYLCRTVSYILSIIKNPAAYSAEKLSLAVEGKRGGLADIIKQMFKNLGLMWRKAARRVVDAGIPAIPPYSEVTAAGTSKYCYACGIAGFTGIIDRRVNKDFGYCKRCGIIVDCHLNAAKNIAALHPKCPREKGGGGVFREKVKKRRKKKGKAVDSAPPV